MSDLISDLCSHFIISITCRAAFTLETKRCTIWLDTAPS